MKRSGIVTLVFLMLLIDAFAQAPGTLDETFGFMGIVLTDFDDDRNTIQKVLVQDDGKIIACGFTGYLFYEQYCSLARYTADGNLDATFGDAGKATFSFGGDESPAYDMILDNEGRILVTGYATSGPTNDIALARLTADGIPDPSFGNSGIKITDLGHDEMAISITVQDDGKIVVAGDVFYSGGGGVDMFICRYHSNGSTDTGFGTNGHIVHDLNNGSTDMPDGLLIHQGKILCCASAFNGNSGEYDALVLARFNDDGSPDVSFGIGGFSKIDGLSIGNMISYPRTDLAIAPGNKIVVSGQIDGIEGNDFAIYRFLSNGYPDNTFDEDGMVVTDMIGENSPASVLVQPDGKIVAGGYHYNTTDQDFCIARYLENGELDATFGNYYGVSFLDVSLGGQKYDQINSIVLQADGRIIAGGDAENAGGDSDFALVRYFSGLTVGVESIRSKDIPFEVYPNPNNGEKLFFRLFSEKSGKAVIQLEGMNGSEIYLEYGFDLVPGINEGSILLPGEIPAGCYFVLISSADGMFCSEKIIVY